MAPLTMSLGRPAFAIAFALLAFGAQEVHGQDDPFSQLAELPQCGITCFMNIVNETPCSLTDINCMCTDPSFESLGQDCVLASCSTDEAIEVSKFQASVCNQSFRSRKHELLIPLVVEGPAWFCPWLHLYSRYVTVGRWALDDWLMLLVGLLYSVFLGIGQTVGQVAFGVDLWTLDADQITMALKFFYIDESFYLVCLGLTKVSVLFLYLRIFPSKKVRIAIYTAMGFVVIPTATLLSLQILQCRPITHIWEGWQNANSEAECFNLHTLVYTAAGFTIVQDLVILLLPLPSVYNLKVEKRAKWGIVIMFSLGIFITCTSCIRLRYIAVFDRTVNPTWDYTEVLIWTGLEVAVAIIVACMPAIGVILKRFWPQSASRASSDYKKGLSKSANIPDRESTHADGRGLFDSDSQTRTYRSGRGRGEKSESQVELGLELGDKAKGDVHTEVSRYRGERYSESADEYEMKNNIGIAITTVTTVTVDERRDSFCPMQAQQRWEAARHS